MTPSREAEVLRHIETLASLDEAHAFREALRDAGERLTTEVYAGLIRRMDLLRKREGVTNGHRIR
jgi:hypothetical protein